MAMIDVFAIMVKDADIGERLRVKIGVVKPNFAIAKILEKIEN